MKQNLITFFNAIWPVKKQPQNPFLNRFSQHTDACQWNGGRHLNGNSMQNCNCKNVNLAIDTAEFNLQAV